jgi:G:T-mismatch repair DNA endonuclease (very short patch repair protein)
LQSKYKISIDLFGDYFHANPNIERFSDETILYRAKTAKEIRDKDKIRQSKLENEGYRAIVVWEQDLKNNPLSILNIIKNELNAFTTDII